MKQTVAILINGHPIMARSAVNISEGNKGKQRYKVDDGTILEHEYEKGVVKLAIELLKAIKE